MSTSLSAKVNPTPISNIVRFSQSKNSLFESISISTTEKGEDLVHSSSVGSLPSLLKDSPTERNQNLICLRTALAALSRDEVEEDEEEVDVCSLDNSIISAMTFRKGSLDYSNHSCVGSVDRMDCSNYSRKGSVDSLDCSCHSDRYSMDDSQSYGGSLDNNTHSLIGYIDSLNGSNHSVKLHSAKYQSSQAGRSTIFLKDPLDANSPKTIATTSPSKEILDVISLARTPNILPPFCTNGSRSNSVSNTGGSRSPSFSFVPNKDNKNPLDSKFQSIISRPYNNRNISTKNSIQNSNYYKDPLDVSHRRETPSTPSPLPPSRTLLGTVRPSNRSSAPIPTHTHTHIRKNSISPIQKHSPSELSSIK
jgi:hypothetical protein